MPWKDESWLAGYPEGEGRRKQTQRGEGAHPGPTGREKPAEKEQSGT